MRRLSLLVCALVVAFAAAACFGTEPPPPPQPPNVVIKPEDVLAEGARPDAQQKASKGNTEERARNGGMSNEPPNDVWPYCGNVRRSITARRTPAPSSRARALRSRPAPARAPGSNEISRSGLARSEIAYIQVICGASRIERS